MDAEVLAGSVALVGALGLFLFMVVLRPNAAAKRETQAAADKAAATKAAAAASAAAAKKKAAQAKSGVILFILAVGLVAIVASFMLNQS